MKSLFKGIRENFLNKVNLYLIENLLGLISATKHKEVVLYVDSLLVELFGKTPVKFAKYMFSGNKVLSTLVAGAVIDGLTLAENDVICLAGQTNPTENGLWLIRNVSVPERPSNYSSSEIQHGSLVLVLVPANDITDRLWVSVVTGMNIGISKLNSGICSYEFEATEGQTEFIVPMTQFIATDHYIPYVDMVPQRRSTVTRIGNVFTYAPGLSEGQVLLIVN